MNDEKNDIVYHSIDGKEFYVPFAIQYNQYYKATKLLEDNKIEFGENVDIEIKNTEVVDIVLRAGKIIGDIIKANIVPDFFAIILLPKGCDSWEDNFIEKNRKSMYKITDLQMMAVFSDFLSSKKPLIESLLLKWKGFRPNTKK